jgi:hypothetical protein
MRWHPRPWVFGAALAVAAGASLPFFLGAKVHPRRSFFEVTLAADAPGSAKVYYDLGSGFQEHDSVAQVLRGGTGASTYRFELPAGVYVGLRLDPLNHPGAASFSGARIVDSKGDVLRRFSAGDFAPTHDIDELHQDGAVVGIRTPPAGGNPYLLINTGGAFVLGLGLWERLAAALPAFLLVFAGVACVGSLLPEGAVRILRPGAGRWLVAGGVSLVALKLWLVAGQTISAVGPAAHDDRLFLEQAASLLAGRWLGPYSQFALMKGPMYPFFVAAVFLLGVPLFAAQHLLYALACWLVVRALRPLVPGRCLGAVLFAVLLFNPITFDGPRLMRVARQDLLPAEVLLLVAGFVALYARRAGPKRTLAPWAVLAASVLPAFWLTREDGVWLLPCVGILWAAAAAAVWFGRQPDRLARLALVALPALGWVAGMGAVSAVNFRHYGLFTTCEFRRPEFKAAYGALLRVEPAAWRIGVVVPREARERIYAVSPAFAELRPTLEGPVGEGWAAASQGMTHLPAADHEFAAGWFVWALRDAVTAAGHAHSGPEAMAFYARLAREVNTACDAGLLKGGPARTGFQPPLRRELLGPVWDSAVASSRLAFYFEGLTAYSSPSVGTPESLVLFSDLTRGRLAPTPDGAHLWPRERWLDGVRVRILQEIWIAYALAAPWAVPAGLLALLASVLVAAVRRRAVFLAIAGVALLASVCAMIAICALVDATSFYAADPMYLAGCYGPVLLLVFVGWLALAGAFRRNPR